MTMLKRTAIILPLLLAACAQAPQRAAEPAAAPPAPQAEAAEVLPDIALSDDLLYEFLLGEVALQRGRGDVAAQAYLDLAHETRDPRVVRRAAQVALQSRQMDKALDAFHLWLELEPDSAVAKQMLATLLLSGDRLEEAQPYLQEIIAGDPASAGHSLMQIYPLIARSPDKQAAYKLVVSLTQPYPKVAEAHWVLAQAAEAAGRHEQALAEAQQVRSLSPRWEMAALLEAQLLQRDDPQRALAVLKKYLAWNPDSREVRLLYARTLLDQKQYAEARDEFRMLLKAHPENAELAFAVALLSMQMGEFDQAEQELRQALASGKQDQDTVYYYLGQLSEAKKDYDAALQQYRQVAGGEYHYQAQLRVIYLLGKQGKLDEARAVLHRIDAQNNQQRVQLVLIEGQLLADAQQFAAAYKVLLQGLEKLPNHPQLLYEAALLADKIGKPDELERLIRKLIHEQPNNANAYNALGYSLLERNVRLQEGMKLVEKAYQLVPNDAAITDSVGWGHYRLGNLDQSLTFLRKAYALNPDPEIAAHLGEVLWVHGDRDEAQKVWSDSLKLHPGNTSLRAVMKKFMH
ncbi:MAG: tetratricopeptide repeat protein [Sideroxydans sp.]|nr:tetratricopeptide repeat protein [Sideroxydans sp.]